MTIFYYEAADSAGKTVGGTIEANDQKEAATLIRAKDIFPTNISLRPIEAPAPTDSSEPQVCAVGLSTQRCLMMLGWFGILCGLLLMLLGGLAFASAQAWGFASIVSGTVLCGLATVIHLLRLIASKN